MTDPNEDEPWCVFYLIEDEEDAVYEQAEDWCFVDLSDDADAPSEEEPAVRLRIADAATRAVGAEPEYSLRGRDNDAAAI